MLKYMSIYEMKVTSLVVQPCKSNAPSLRSASSSPTGPLGLQEQKRPLEIGPSGLYTCDRKLFFRFPHRRPSSRILLYLYSFSVTRVTNLGRKQKHVEATFNYHEIGLEDSDAESLLESAIDGSTAVTNSKGANFEEDGLDTDGQPPKKRRRGTRKKADGKATTGTVDEGEDGNVNGEGMENGPKEA